MGKTQDIGRIGEDVACQYLERKGFSVIRRNYRAAWGEIDIIAEYGGIVRFVEVKAISRENLDAISREMNTYRPEEQAHARKLEKVARTASAYMAAEGDEREFQIDVVAVYLDVAHKRARCRLYEQVL